MVEVRPQLETETQRLPPESSGPHPLSSRDGPSCALWPLHTHGRQLSPCTTWILVSSLKVEKSYHYHIISEVLLPETAFSLITTSVRSMDRMSLAWRMLRLQIYCLGLWLPSWSCLLLSLNIIVNGWLPELWISWWFTPFLKSKYIVQCATSQLNVSRYPLATPLFTTWSFPGAGENMLSGELSIFYNTWETHSIWYQLQILGYVCILSLVLQMWNSQKIYWHS